MDPDEVQFSVDQITRVLKSMGWYVVVVSTEGPTVRLTVEKTKEKILKP